MSLSESRLEWVEPGIMLLVHHGPMNEADVRAITEGGVRFADEAGVEQYVLVIDARKATITFMNVRLAKWSVERDSRMIHTCYIGSSMMAQTIASILAKLTRMPVEFFSGPEDALERARAVLKERKSLH